MDTASITKEVRDGLADLFRSAELREGDLFVVGCSTSEVSGHMIGTSSSEEIAKAVMEAVMPQIQARKLYLATQCCEHLNRVLVVERAAQQKYDLTEVSVKPWLHAGGAFAVHTVELMEDPVMVEDLHAKAAAGIDIGGTFIGMHIRPVLVPVHSEHRRVGEAVLTMARSRPKYVGGPRAHYEPLKAH